MSDLNPNARNSPITAEKPIRHANSPQPPQASVQQHHHRTASSSSNVSADQSQGKIVFTPYVIGPGHTLNTFVRLSKHEWKPETESSKFFEGKGDNDGIIIFPRTSIENYNKIQTGQKERIQAPDAKISFRVFLQNSETKQTGQLLPELRTLRFWLDNSPIIDSRSNGKNNNQDKNDDELERQHQRSLRQFVNIKQESSQLVQAYFRELIGLELQDFPKSYEVFFMKLMRLLKGGRFARIVKVEVELRQLALEDQQGKPPSPVLSVDGSQSGRGSPLTSQKVLDIIESSYPNPVSVKEICSTTQTDECIVRQLVDELASKEKINTTDNGQHFTRTTKPIDTKVNMVKHMPKVTRSQQPVIAIITAQYCEKLAVDSMISDKETFVRYRVTSGQQDSNGPIESSSNYVYTLGNIGDHRVVSTKLTSIGHSRGASIAAGNATTRLLGTFPDIEYVFLVGCGGGVVNYSDFSSHVRLGDVVISHLPSDLALDDSSSNKSGPHDEANLSRHNCGGSESLSLMDYVYVHCRPKLQQDNVQRASGRTEAGIPVSYSVHKNLKRATTNDANELDGAENRLAATCTTKGGEQPSSQSIAGSTDANDGQQATANKLLSYEECHFRLWRPVRLDLQELAQRLWKQGLENPKHRIWDYYIDEGIKTLVQQDIEAIRPPPSSDKLFMSVGLNDSIEVNHPEAGDDEIDLRRDGRPMCHFGPIGSGRPAIANEKLKQRIISEFGLCAFDSEFDPVVESIYGNRKESYIMIRGISDYKDGRKKKEWQQYSAVVAAAFMKSIIVNLKPLN